MLFVKNTFKFQPSLFCLTILFIGFIALPLKSEELLFKDGISAKIHIVDTTGCYVVICRNGAMVSINKDKLQMIVIKKDTIHYGSFHCEDNRPPTKPVPCKESDLFEPSENSTMEEQLFNLISNAPTSPEKLIASQGFLYCSYPLAGSYIKEQFDLLSTKMVSTFSQFSTCTVVPIDTLFNCFTMSLSLCKNARYLIIPLEIKREVKDVVVKRNGEVSDKIGLKDLLPFSSQPPGRRRFFGNSFYTDNTGRETFLPQSPYTDKIASIKFVIFNMQSKRTVANHTLMWTSDDLGPELHQQWAKRADRNGYLDATVNTFIDKLAAQFQ